MDHAQRRLLPQLSLSLASLAFSLSLCLSALVIRSRGCVEEKRDATASESEDREASIRSDVAVPLASLILDVVSQP